MEYSLPGWDGKCRHFPEIALLSKALWSVHLVTSHLEIVTTLEKMENAEIK